MQKWTVIPSNSHLQDSVKAAPAKAAPAKAVSAAAGATTEEIPEEVMHSSSVLNWFELISGPILISVGMIPSLV